MNVILKEFKVLGKKGEGTFSEVLKCQNNKDQKYYACKKMKHTYTSWEQVNALREIQAMRRLSPHPFIVQLEEIVFDKRSGSLVLVLELMDLNLYEFIRGRRHYLPEAKVQAYMWQMMRGIEHMHRLGIFHRDVKPENLLIRDDRLKLADFGSCRSVKSHPPFTEYISTRWYRAPECLLTDGHYGAAMDIWSAGCVVYEVTSLRPLFPGSNEVDQIAKIHDVLGTPVSDVLLKFKGKSRHVSYNFPVKRGAGLDGLLTGASAPCAEAVKRMLEYDPDARPTARTILKLPYFRDFRPKGEVAAAIQQHQQEVRQKRGAAAAAVPVAGSSSGPDGKENVAAAIAASTAHTATAGKAVAMATAAGGVGASPSPKAPAAAPSVSMATAASTTVSNSQTAVAKGKITPVLESPGAAGAGAGAAASVVATNNKFNAKELQQQRLRRRRIGQLYGQQQQQQHHHGLGVSFPSLMKHQQQQQQQHHSPVPIGNQQSTSTVRHAAALLGGGGGGGGGPAALGFAGQSLSKQQQFYGSQARQFQPRQPQQQQQQQQRLFLPRGQLPSIKQQTTGNNKHS